MPYNHPLTTDAKKKLDDLYNQLREASSMVTGYPCNLDFDYSELYPFLTFHINNIGDPSESSNYRVNTHDIECEVLAFFAKLVHAGTDYTGYVTNGGTEGNLYGLNIASQMYPDGIIYYSEQTHYSIPKIIKIIKSKYKEIPADSNGEINYEKLEKALQENQHLPAIINVNIGSTMTGAIDNIDKIRRLIVKAGIDKYYLHCDAALSGMILPFINNPQPFDFQAGVHSIAISGHKFIGSPIPCGIVLTKTKYLLRFSSKIAYVNITDTTIACSRSGLTPLFLWYAIQRHGEDGFKELCVKCLHNTQYAVARLTKAGINAWANPNSISVVFPKPSEALIQKWQLAPFNGEAHFMVMPSTSQKVLKQLLGDLIAELS